MPPIRITSTSDRLVRRTRFLLVVDSDADSLLSLSMLLQRFECTVCVARTAGEALQLAEENAPAGMITALRLADIDGIELVQQLRLVSDCAGIPVLLAKKRSDELNARDCFYHGVAGCFSLPVLVEDLYRAVQDAIEKIPRKNIRIKTHLAVQAAGTQHDSLENACTIDLSERGMFVRSAKPAGVNTRLSCRIHLLDQIIEVEAAVLYNQTTTGTYRDPGMGIEFVRIAPNDQKIIRQYIREEIMRGLEPGNIH